MTPGDAPEADHHALHLTWTEARETAARAAGPIPPSDVPLAASVGRTLAEDVTALRDMPHYASSAMDGWAVRGTGPWVLAETGERLAAHEASTIVTGGDLPPGTSAVLRREHGEVAPDEDGLPHLRLAAGAPPGSPRGGADIRPAGEEARAGEVLVPAGTVLTPAHVALAALAGYDGLTVTGRPLVRLVRTGGEVVESGLPGPGLVRDVFSHLVPPLLAAYGGILAGHDRIGDDAGEWAAALADVPQGPESAGADDAGHGAAVGAPADVVVTTGGTGRGGSDHLRGIVADMGGRILVDGVAMRPGHPTVLAELPDGRFVLGLPGNPLAAIVGLVAVGEPLLAALSGREPLTAVELPSGEAFEADPRRTRIVPFRRVYGMASPRSGTGSGMLRGLAAADGLMVVPPHGVELGEPVACLPLPWGRPLVEPGAGGARKGRGQSRGGSRGSSGSKDPVDWSALDV
ncbi:molybdopterin molybdotransferase MoeA [Sinomonas halotolerans]|uniref:Molybdopterin molybdenumtransferase n=1 Tax=Sinomonas halotolerans TaxID=1644133 RepID=A0ABU9WW36_9MICC